MTYTLTYTVQDSTNPYTGCTGPTRATLNRPTRTPTRPTRARTYTFGGGFYNPPDVSGGPDQEVKAPMNRTQSTAHQPPILALDAERAASNLGALLDRHAASVPCIRMPDQWTSESYRDRVEAAAACTHCPVLDACAAYADAAREQWHVWAGRDRTTATRKGHA